MEEGKSRVLIIGVTGNLGHHLAQAALQFSHPTFALVRPSTFSDPHKSHKLHSLSNAGVTLLQVSLSLSLNFSLKNAGTIFEKKCLFLCVSGFAGRRREPNGSGEASGCGNLCCFGQTGPPSEAPYPSHQTSWLHQGLAPFCFLVIASLGLLLERFLITESAFELCKY